jgi:hypothetical protein
MDGDNEDTRLLRALVARRGKDWVEETLRQIAPRKRGSPKGTKKPRYLDIDRVLMLKAEKLWHSRLYTKRISTHRALQLTVEKYWPGYLSKCIKNPDGSSRRRGGASKKAAVRRLWARFKKEPFVLDDITEKPWHDFSEK